MTMGSPPRLIAFPPPVNPATRQRGDRRHGEAGTSAKPSEGVAQFVEHRASAHWRKAARCRASMVTIAPVLGNAHPATVRSITAALVPARYLGRPGGWFRRDSLFGSDHAVHDG